jgi:hypothetical protein
MSNYERAARSVIVAALIAQAVAAALPTLNLGLGVTIYGHELFRAWYYRLFGHLDEGRWPAVLANAATLSFWIAVVLGLASETRTGWTAAGFVCLVSCVLTRIATVLLNWSDWYGRGLLIGYWVWIGAMVMAAAGFLLLAQTTQHSLACGAGDPPFAADEVPPRMPKP